MVWNTIQKQLLYSLYAYSHQHIHMHIHVEWITTNTTIKGRAKTSFIKNMYLSLYCKGFERVYSRFCVWEGVWRPKQNCNILTPTLMAVNVVSFLFSRAAQPEAQGLSFLLSAGFLYHILSTNFLWTPNPSGVPKGPLQPGVAFPTILVL